MSTTLIIICSIPAGFGAWIVFRWLVKIVIISLKWLWQFKRTFQAVSLALCAWACVTIFIFGVAAIPVFYRCRIAQTYACMYEDMTPDQALNIATKKENKR